MGSEFGAAGRGRSRSRSGSDWKGRYTTPGGEAMPPGDLLPVPVDHAPETVGNPWAFPVDFVVDGPADRRVGPPPGAEIWNHLKPLLPRDMTDSSHVRTERSDRIATITIDREKKLNALNPQVIRELGEAFEVVRDDGDVLGVILTGAGERAFVAGADIGVLAEMTPTSGVEVSRQGQDVLRNIETFPKPVLAAVNGYALGGGCELALACHMRLAADTAQFGLPEVGLGIIPGYGGTIRMARLVGLGHAVQLTLTGERIDARRAEVLGLVNGVAPASELMDRARELMGKVVRNGPVAVRMALESVYHALDATTDDAQRLESSLFGLLASTSDMKEGMSAFLEKRKADFRGT